MYASNLFMLHVHVFKRAKGLCRYSVEHLANMDETLAISTPHNITVYFVDKVPAT